MSDFRWTLFAAAFLLIGAPALAADGVAVEALKVEPRAGGYVRVLVTVKNDLDYLADVEVGCSLYADGAPVGEAHGFVSAVSSNDTVVGSLIEKSEGKEAKCRLLGVRKAD